MLLSKLGSCGVHCITEVCTELHGFECPMYALHLGWFVGWFGWFTNIHRQGIAWYYLSIGPTWNIASQGLARSCFALHVHSALCPLFVCWLVWLVYKHTQTGHSMGLSKHRSNMEHCIAGISTELLCIACP